MVGLTDITSKAIGVASIPDEELVEIVQLERSLVEDGVETLTGLVVCEGTVGDEPEWGGHAFLLDYRLDWEIVDWS